MKLKLLYCLAAFLSFTSQAQLVLDHTYNEEVVARVQLENSGEKYYMYNPSTSTVDFFNPDHSFWKSVPIITTPDIFSFRICHVSENMLDDDPDIDIAYAFYTAGDPSIRSYIVNENGSVALEVLDCIYYDVVTLSDGTVKILAHILNGSRVYSSGTFALEHTFDAAAEFRNLEVGGDIFFVFDKSGGKADIFRPDYVLWKSIQLPKPADATYTSLSVFSEHDVNTNELIELSYTYTAQGNYYSRLVDENGNTLLEVPDAYKIGYDAPVNCTPKLKVERSVDDLVQPVRTDFYSLPALQLEYTYEGYAEHLALELSGEVFYYVDWSQEGPNYLQVRDASHAPWKTVPLPIPGDMFGYHLVSVDHLSETILDDEPDLEVIYSFYEALLSEWQMNYTTNVVNENGDILNSIPLAAGMQFSVAPGWEPKFIAKMTYGIVEGAMGFVPYFSSVWNVGEMAGVPEHSISVLVYPNPVIDKLVIIAPGKRFVRGEVLDLLGRTVKVVSGDDIRQLDLSGVGAGHWILKLTDEQGVSVNRKILKG